MQPPYNNKIEKEVFMSKIIEHIEINPEVTPVASILWLHGLGADGNDFAPVAKELATAHSLPPLRFVLPHAPFQPITVNQGYVMRAWYDIVSLDIDRHADQAGIRQSVQQVERLVLAEKQRGLPAHRIFLAGFSQGAVIATATALSCSEPLGGLIALSGYLPYEKETLAHLPRTSPPLPIFMGHGEEDSIVPVSLGEKMHQALHAAGYPVTWHHYPMPHSVCAKEIRDIAEWLRHQLKM